MGASSSATPIMSRVEAVAPHALQLPIFNKLKSKRVVLASASPRRKEILETFGLRPEVVKSTFAENLPHSRFDTLPPATSASASNDSAQPKEKPVTHSAMKGMGYTVATATEKAVEVYRRLVEESPDDPPDLVISADTVVVSSLPSPSSSTLPLEPATILEKPSSKADHLRMLLELVAPIPSTQQSDVKGGVLDEEEDRRRVEVVSGVVVVYPVLESPGYRVSTMAETTRLWFGDVPLRTLEAYVESGEGIDRAGGFAVQGLGGHLVRRIDGDYNNVVGFPAFAFFRFLEKLMKEDDEFLAD